MDFTLTGKAAIVTGAAGSIGAWYARTLAQAALNVLHQIGEPDDLAGALLFFASPASDWTTGQCLNVDGGWVMRT
jgi:NAD(P)-dependent dehydrogenase (short-subunit alcohol dehydrogenase family)